MSKQQYESDIVLGERYREEQTGLTGTATAIYFFMNGCERVCIELLNSDGDLKEYAFDAPRLIHEVTGVQATSKRTGGAAKEHGVTRGPAPRSH